MIIVAGMWTFNNEDSSGIKTYTGTSEIQSIDPVRICKDEDHFFVGQIENLSSVAGILILRGFGGLEQKFRLRGKESVRIRGCPIRELDMAVNGTIQLRGVGNVLLATSEEDRRELLLNSNIIERNATETGSLTFPTYDHTDISTATTTTLATPASDKIIRVYKITVAVQGASRPILRWTDSDGTSNPNIIGQANFTGEGSFVYDFGDEGLLCPNGIDGLLRLVSNNTAVLDIDVISEDV